MFQSNLTLNEVRLAHILKSKTLAFAYIIWDLYELLEIKDTKCAAKIMMLIDVICSHFNLSVMLERGTIDLSFMTGLDCPCW